MPILQYLFGVGGTLICFMFVLNAYVPAASPREQHEIDKSTIRISAAASGDYAIDHVPAVHGDPATASNDAVRNAMAMMPLDDDKQLGRNASNRNASNRNAAIPATPHKRRLTQRAKARLANDEPPSPTGRVPTSSGWSNSSPGNWNSNWSWNSSPNLFATSRQRY